MLTDQAEGNIKRRGGMLLEQQPAPTQTDGGFYRAGGGRRNWNGEIGVCAMGSACATELRAGAGAASRTCRRGCCTAAGIPRRRPCANRPTRRDAICPIAAACGRAAGAAMTA